MVKSYNNNTFSLTSAHFIHGVLLPHLSIHSFSSTWVCHLAMAYPVIVSQWQNPCGSGRSACSWGVSQRRRSWADHGLARPRGSAQAWVPAEGQAGMFQGQLGLWWCSAAHPPSPGWHFPQCMFPAAPPSLWQPARYRSQAIIIQKLYSLLKTQLSLVYQVFIDDTFVNWPSTDFRRLGLSRSATSKTKSLDIRGKEAQNQNRILHHLFIH